MLRLGVYGMTALGAAITFSAEYVNDRSQGKSLGESIGRARILTVSSIGGTVIREALGATADPLGAGRWRSRVGSCCWSRRILVWSWTNERI